MLKMVRIIFRVFYFIQMFVSLGFTTNDHNEIRFLWSAVISFVNIEKKMTSVEQVNCVNLNTLP